MKGFLLFSLAVSFSLEASSATPQQKVLGRFFRKIPVSEALSSFGSARERELKSDSIKVLVWNIKKTQMKPWPVEFSEYARGKDLFLIQEAYDTSRFLDVIKSYEGFRWEMGKSFTYNLYDNHATGTMIGASAQPEEVIVTHTQDHEPMTNTPKAMTYARYGLEGSEKSLLVISVHAINFTTLGPFKRNMLQARAEIEKHDGPVLFAGDFNTHHALRTNYLMNMMKELNFTTIKFLNGHQRMKFKLTGSYLDHGFVRGLKVNHAEVLGKAQGSDHKPMVLDLALDTI
ncbi:MAG: endonuclease/exonuclease/phosphatase family protein [Bdellovibrionota bacterium]